MMQQPKVSIIMGIYNCEATLQRCFNSLLKQTFSDWQLIMCEDGSQDATYNVAQRIQKSYPDKIILLRNQKNLGLNETLNRCLAVATGKYIARQDADDLSLPDRLRLEVDFLDHHPEYALVSGCKDHFDSEGFWGNFVEIEKPTMKDIFFGPPFCHPACMMRAEALRKIGGYSVAKRLLRVEDYHLWYKFYRAGFKGYNLQQTIYLYADDRDAYSKRNWQNRLNEMHLKRLIIKEEHLPCHYHFFTFRPVIVGLLPTGIYHYLHQHRLQN